MPRATTDHIFHLIQSLNKGERNYFRAQARRKGTDGAKYLQLFDLILKQKKYDEEALIKKLNPKNSSQFSSLKEFLYKQILEAMRSYGVESKVEFKVSAIIEDVHFLFDKGLIKQAQKALNKGLKLVQDHQMPYEEMKLRRWESRMAQMERKVKKTERIQEAAIQAELDILSRITQTTEISKYYHRFFRLHTQIGLPRTPEQKQAFQEIVDEVNRIEESELKSYSAKVYVYGLNYMWGLITGDNEIGYINAKKQADLMAEYPEIIKHHPSNYLASLNNVLNMAGNTLRRSVFEDYMKKMKELGEQYKLDETGFIYVYTIIRVYLLEFQLYNALGEFDKVTSVVDQFTKDIEPLEGKIDPLRLHVAWYRIAYAYFALGDYQAALNWMNKIFNDKKIETGLEYQAYFRILNLLIHYERKNYDYLEYLGESTTRFLKARNKWSRFEQTAVDLICYRWPLFKKESALEKSYLKALDIIEELHESSGNWQWSVGDLNLEAWLHSKINRTSFTEEIQSRVEVR